jgi:hypothetical protein
MPGKRDQQVPPAAEPRTPLIRDASRPMPRFDSQTGRPLATGEPGTGLRRSHLAAGPPERRSTLVRDLVLVVLHLGVYGVVIGGILYQAQFIGPSAVFSYANFDAIFWPAYAWGTLIAAQAGAAILQRRRLLGAMLGAMASVLLGSLILAQIGEYVVVAIVFRSVAVALAALTIAVSLLRRAPAILAGPALPVAPRMEPAPVLARSRRSGFGSVPSFVLGLFALVFVLAALAHGTYRALEVRGSGVMAERQIDVGPFRRIDIGGTGHLVVREGDQVSLTVTGDDNLLERVEATSADGQLSLRFDPGGRGPVRLGILLTYVVTVPSLDTVSISDDATVTLDPGRPFGSLRIVAGDNGRVDADGLVAESLSLALRGDATLRMSGEAREVVIDVGDQTLVDVRDLASSNVNATVWDRSTVRLGDTGILQYRQSGSATILCDRPLDISPKSDAAIRQCTGQGGSRS